MSGAVYACITIAALVAPGAEARAFFVIPLTLENALVSLVVFDVCGVLVGFMGWR